MQVVALAPVAIRGPENTYGYIWIRGFGSRFGHPGLCLEQHLRSRQDLFKVHMDGGYNATGFVTTLTAKGRNISIADLIDEGESS